MTTPNASNAVVQRDAEPSLVTRALHVKAIDAEKRTVEFVASTGIVDSHDEIVDQGSWILDDYLQNPVVLWAHESRELPIGRAVDVAVRNGRLEVAIEFATEDLNEKAEQVFRMVQSKFLKAVSVGFLPKTYRWEMRNGAEVFVWADCVLKEVSVTPIGANPEALAKMKSLAERLPRETTAKDAPPLRPSDGAFLDELLRLGTDAPNQVERAERAIGVAAPKETPAPSPNVEVRTAPVANEKMVEMKRAHDEAVERATAAETKLIELEVDALVGAKITSSERDLFVQLRRENPTLFAKMIGERADMNLLTPIIAGTREEAGVARAIDPTTADANADVVTEAQKLGRNGPVSNAKDVVAEAARLGGGA